MTLKRSKQRDAILQFLMTRKDHPTADTVYMNVRETYPNISLGTVYRNLQQLTEIGSIQKVQVGDGVDHFDADISTHYHFLCNDCGGVIDLAVGDLGDICSKAAEGFPGEITGHATFFFGRCEKCAKKRKQTGID